MRHCAALPDCHALFLHVITYNDEAMQFYSRHGFQCTRKLKGAPEHLALSGALSLRSRGSLAFTSEAILHQVGHGSFWAGTD